MRKMQRSHEMILLFLTILTIHHDANAQIYHSSKTGIPNVVKRPPQVININRTHSFFSSVPEITKQEVELALFEAIEWLNWYLGVHAFEYYVYESDDYDVRDLGDNYSHLVYKPQVVVSNSGNTVAGETNSRSNYKYFLWLKQHPDRDIGELTDHVVDIFIPITKSDRDYFLAVIKHELLHTLGFAHAHDGLMSSNLVWKKSDRYFINSLQLREWEQASGNTLNIKGGDPETNMLYEFDVDSVLNNLSDLSRLATQVKNFSDS